MENNYDKRKMQPEFEVLSKAATPLKQNTAQVESVPRSEFTIFLIHGFLSSENFKYRRRLEEWVTGLAETANIPLTASVYRFDYSSISMGGKGAIKAQADDCYVLLTREINKKLAGPFQFSKTQC